MIHRQWLHHKDFASRIFEPHEVDAAIAGGWTDSPTTEPKAPAQEAAPKRVGRPPKRQP